MVRFFLTRHGETEWNVEGRLQGRKDSPLTPFGEQQANWLGKRLASVPLDVIISSSSGRAMRTAEIVRQGRGIDIVPNDSFQEIHIGEWEGKYRLDFEEQDPKLYENFWYYPHLYAPTSGETFSQVLARVKREILSITEKYCGKNVLVVTHAVALKALTAFFQERQLEDFWGGPFMHATNLTVVETDGSDHKILLHGDISHYPPEYR